VLCETLGDNREAVITRSQDWRTWARVVGHLGEEVYPPEWARRMIRKLEIVWMPFHRSWLNIADLELAVLSHNASRPASQTFLS
jgi:hypothetical protein